MIVRQVTPADLHGIESLLFYGDMAFRHLDWLDVRGWYLNPTTMVMENNGELVAVCVMPEEPIGIYWIRLLLKQRNYPTRQVLHGFWGYWLANGGDKRHVATIQQNLDAVSALNELGFITRQSIVFLQRQENAPYPAFQPDEVRIRPMLEQDLDVVAQVDAESFAPLWRNSQNTLAAGLRANGYGTVAVFGGDVIGYQLSNQNYGGMHLARLAVSPQHRGRQIGAKLIAGLLLYADMGRCGNISVNTQSDNAASLALYKRMGFSVGTQAFPVYEFIG